jgi:uncharacterized protein
MNPEKPANTPPNIAAPSTSASPVVEESLIVYPCAFPIKVMGAKVDGFDPTFDAKTLELRESKGGNYLGITVTVTATSRAQLDELYRTLSTHPMVKMVL